MSKIRDIVKLLFCCTVLIFTILGFHTAHAQDKKIGLLLTINGAIGPATQDYFHRGIKTANKKNAVFIIIQLDTPGGLDQAMRGIIKLILSSKIPIITYVAPEGARAASAGTYILYASHIAAMAPGTNIGAATPIAINTSLNDSNKPEDVEKQKMLKDAQAFIRSLAQLRDRNVSWAEKAVLEAETLSADEALKMKVIDVIAKNIPDLLTQVDGRQVNVLGKMYMIDTLHAEIIKLKPDWRSRLLGIITDPSIAYILMLLGIYGLFFEFANPGYILPGVAGAISLVLALYAFQLLPVNYAGLVLVFLGLAFLVGEAYVPSFGVLGLGGIFAFVAGSVLLIEPNSSGYMIHWSLVLSMAVVSAAFFLFVVTMAVRARRRHIVTGVDELVNLQGVALNDFTEEGLVRVHGEIWRAKTKDIVKTGQTIIVSKVEGLLLTVELLKNNNIEEGK
ncbi:MAG: nodulation protein NfeD [Gammaproteobacteria bacterium]